MVMKRYLGYTLSLITLLVWLMPDLKAQSAYHGGSGDGYAMAETKGAQVGREDPEDQFRLVAYPQPLTAGERLKIRLPGTKGENLRYRIYAIQGQTLQKGQWAVGTAKPGIRLPASTKPGVYVLRVTTADGTYTKRLAVTTP